MPDRLERLLRWHAKRAAKREREKGNGLCWVGGPYHHNFMFHKENGHYAILYLDGPARLRK